MGIDIVVLDISAYIYVGAPGGMTHHIPSPAYHRPERDPGR